VFGLIVGVFGFWASIIPILALGLGALILGVMILFLPESTATRVDRLATASGLPALLNIEAMMVDLDASARGIYIPTTGFGVAPKVLVPLSDSVMASLSKARLARSGRVFVTLGTGMYDRGILLYPPGGEILQALESCLQLDLGTIGFDELPEKMGFGFETLGISKRGISIELEEPKVRFQMNLTSLIDLEERLRLLAPRVIEQVGSPLTSAVAATVAKTTGRFVRLMDSNVNQSTLSGTLELLETAPK